MFSSSLQAFLLTALFLVSNAKAQGCCSMNYKACDAPWCGTTESSCNACGDGEMLWLANGPVTSSCQERYSDCTNDSNACCPGLQCKFVNDFYSQCLPGEPNPPIPAPTGCCSLNYQDCDAPWCGSSESECNSCAGDQLLWLPNGPQTQCLARWEECTNDSDGCCGGLECQFSSEFYGQCLPGHTNPLPPTEAPVASPPREACEDNPDVFFYKSKDVSCADIAQLGPQQRARKCKEGRRLVDECPSYCQEECATPSPTGSPTVGLPDDCTNVEGSFFFKGKDVSCADIAVLGKQKRRRKCNDGRKIEENCPAVCKEECEP